MIVAGISETLRVLPGKQKLLFEKTFDFDCKMHSNINYLFGKSLRHDCDKLLTFLIGCDVIVGKFQARPCCKSLEK